MVQVYTDKAGTILGYNAVVAHHEHAVSFKRTKDFEMVLIDQGYTIVALLLVSSAFQYADEDDSEEQGPGISPVLPFSNCLMWISDGCTHDVKLQVLQTAIQEIMRPLQTNLYSGFSVSVSGKTWMCHSVVWPY